MWDTLRQFSINSEKKFHFKMIFSNGILIGFLIGFLSCVFLNGFLSCVWNSVSVWKSFNS